MHRIGNERQRSSRRSCNKNYRECPVQRLKELDNWDVMSSLRKRKKGNLLWSSLLFRFRNCRTRWIPWIMQKEFYDPETARSSGLSLADRALQESGIQLLPSEWNFIKWINSLSTPERSWLCTELEMRDTALQDHRTRSISRNRRIEKDLLHRNWESKTIEDWWTFYSRERK